MKSSSKKLFKVIITEEAALDIEDAAYYFIMKPNRLVWDFDFRLN